MKSRNPTRAIPIGCHKHRSTMCHILALATVRYHRTAATIEFAVCSWITSLVLSMQRLQILNASLNIGRLLGGWNRMRTLLGSASLLILAPVASHAQERVAGRVPSTRVTESVRPQPVSRTVIDMSGAIYGLTTDAASVAANFPNEVVRRDPAFLVYGLGRQRQDVCLELNQAQGGYKAKFQSLAPAGKGPVLMSYEASLAAKRLLSTQRPSSVELAIRASELVGGRCSRNSPLLPTSWSRVQGGGLTLLVGGSSAGFPETRIAGGGSVRCRRISDLVSQAGLGAGTFGFACPLQPVPQKCDAVLPLQVIWYVLNRRNAQANVAVKTPC